MKPSPIQTCTNAINRLTATQVTGQAAFIKAQAIRDLEEIREQVTSRVSALHKRNRRLEAKLKEKA